MTRSFFDNTNFANGDIRQELDRVLDRGALTALTLFRSTSATWNHKPAHEVDREPTARVVGTNDRIYEIVSETGSRPHTIRPRNARSLRFQTGYKAKTRRGVIGSSSGGASGSVVHSKSVQHPGFEPREFVKAIQEQMDITMERLVNEGLGRLHGA